MPSFSRVTSAAEPLPAPLSLREMFSPAGNSLASADCQMNRDFSERRPISQISERSSFAQHSRSGGCQFLISNRRTVDHGPETPPLFALTRDHILSVGSVLVLN